MTQKWFKAKKYGWGWYPSTWQGWLIIGLYLAIIVYRFYQIDSASHSVSDTLINWIPEVLVVTVLLIIICSLTGERPRWRWGND